MKTSKVTFFDESARHSSTPSITAERLVGSAVVAAVLTLLVHYFFTDLNAYLRFAVFIALTASIIGVTTLAQEDSESRMADRRDKPSRDDDASDDDNDGSSLTPWPLNTSPEAYWRHQRMRDPL